MKGKDIAKEAIKKGCKIREGKGSHIVIRSPQGDSSFVVYHGELSPGVKFKALKWLAALGILTTLLCVALAAGVG